ncbi:DUF748 domain-containing protein [Candidatus Accumulibacter sp. ACC003]|uniref:DUF748 domain-containing protein n=1 Tax=Candidatus Accumulibacter sp. ACC003 TaxID=2823334 RepID=UPI0025C5952F|nr:DUF748 domain-containing protein [Candidatus Accumulibacter sp. ACC003]
MLVFSLLGFFGLPPLVKSILVDQLAVALHRPVTIEGVRINPYTLSLQVAGLAVQDKDGGDALIAFDRLDVDVEWSSLWRGGPVISELKLVAPAFRIVRQADGRFNVSDLVDEFMARPASDDPTPRFSLNNIQISGGKIEFDDQTLGEKHLISELDIGVPFISSLPQATAIYVEPAFSASIDGSPLLIQGKSKPFDTSLESELALDLRAVQVARYLEYLPFSLPIKVTSGALDSELKLAFKRQDEDHSTLVVSGKVALKDVVVKESSGAPLISVRALEVVIDSIEPLDGRFAIERIDVDTPEIHARVSPQGTINWVDFFSKELVTRGTPTPAASKSEKSVPIEWSLATAKVSGGALRWRDESHGEAFDASVDGLQIGLKNFASKGSSAGEFDLAFRMQAGQWIALDAFSAKGGRIDLAKRELAIAEVASHGAKLLIRRAADGTIEFVEPPSLRVVEASRKDSAGPWKVSVAKYRGEDLGLRFEDRMISPAVVHSIDGMKIDAENLSTEPGTTASIATRFMVNKKGGVEVDGKVTLFPLDTDLKVVVKALDLVPLQPYFTEQLNVVLTRGQVLLSGDLRLQQLAAAVAGAETGKLSGAFSGQLAVGDFAAVDKSNSADFLNWKSLSFGHLDLRLNPSSLSIGEVALADFFARVIINPQGKLNLLQVVRQANEPPTALVTKKAEQTTAVVSGAGKAVAPLAGGSESRLPVKVGKITLQGGDIKFSDNFIKPNYSADLKKIGGAISGLSSAAGSVATVDLRGTYDNIAPIKVSGQVNPLIAKPYLDLQADVKGIEMTALSPYSGKYAGYAIEKGKLSLFVKYKVDNNQLTAENRVFLDQLTFGDAVDSPEATKLPVSLAVALLKNSKGEIDINLPVAGSLDDPEFSIGGLLGNLIGNLLVKVVTSPFALLGSLFGGGEELSNVEFDFGQSTITPAAQKRLETLAKALLDRPALKLAVGGHADPEADPEGLKRARLNRKLQELKAAGGKKRDGKDPLAATVDIGADEYPVLLEKVYRAEDFEKPRNMVGLVKTLPADEMEKLILANSVVDDSDLRALAEQRAQVVRDWLLAQQVPAERVFLRPAKIGKVDDKAASPQPAAGNRVVFALE